MTSGESQLPGPPAEPASLPPPDHRPGVPPLVGPTPATGPYRLRRSTSDRMVAGVCGGLGQALGVDPLWFRLAALILALGSGSGVLLYIAAWVLMPEESDGAPVERHPRIHAARGSMVAGLALIGVGTVLLLNRAVPWFDDVLWPVAVIVAGAGLLYAGTRR